MCLCACACVRACVRAYVRAYVCIGVCAGVSMRARVGVWGWWGGWVRQDEHKNIPTQS